METIAQRRLRNDNAEIMRRVEAGETFVVTRNGHPIAEIRPVPTGRRRSRGRRVLARRHGDQRGHAGRADRRTADDGRSD